jgi:hypothetical protein
MMTMMMMMMVVVVVRMSMNMLGHDNNAYDNDERKESKIILKLISKDKNYIH